MKRNIVLIIMAALLFGCNGVTTKDTNKAISGENTPVVEGGGGDHAGNGGFAYEKSYKLLEEASLDLIPKVATTTFAELVTYPERREILLDVLDFNNIIQLPNVDGVMRDNKLLALDYVTGENRAIKIYKPFYERFSGTLDKDFAAAKEEVEILLLHEAAHLWGYNDKEARKFAKALVELFTENSFPGQSSDNIVERPTHAITITEYAICQNGKSLSLNNSEEFCRRKPNTTSPILYAKVELNEEITGNPELRDLYGWCNNSYGDNNNAPSCSVTLTDEYLNAQMLPLTSLGVDSFSVNLSTADIWKDTQILRYKFHLVETESGAISLGSGFKLLQDYVSTRPFKIEPISMYSCIMRSGKITGDSTVEFESTVVQNYLFSESNRPDPVPYNQGFIECHDSKAAGQGAVDKFTYPRLNELPGHISLWSRDDSSLPISGVGALFHELSWAVSPDSTGEEVLNTLGWYMSSWIDENGTPFCPGTANYKNSTDPVLKKLEYYVGETEAIYMAKREPKQIVVGGQEVIAPDNFIMISQSMLEKSWFYYDYKLGKKIRGSRTAALSNTMMFYWPMSDVDPLIQTSGQELYIVRSPDELGRADMYIGPRPADKRFGCIPKQ